MEDKRPETLDETVGDPQTVEEALAGSLAEELNASQFSGNNVEAELAESKDRIMRLQAEMENVRQRTARELADERRYSGQQVMRDVLPVLDNVERAIEAAEKNTDAESLLEGFRLVYQQLMAVLKQHQCERIEANGESFDPEIHEAVLQQPSDEYPAGTVTMVTQPGYRLHDRIVRAPQVIVSSGPTTQE